MTESVTKPADFRDLMKRTTVFAAVAVLMAACGNANDSRAQEGVFAQPTDRQVPRDAGAVKASFAPSATNAAAKPRLSQARTAGRDTTCRRTEAAKQP